MKIMKKVCLLFLFFCVVSCSSNTSKSSISATKFNYGGHSYIRFKMFGSYGDNVIHNPDCLCEIVDSSKF